MNQQNIIDLGFDISKFDAHKQHIMEGLIEVYEKSKAIGQNTIPVSLIAGWSELNAKVQAQEKAITDLTAANAKYTQSAAAAKKVNDEGASSTDKATASNKKKEQSEVALEKIKQQRLKTDQEVVKMIREEDKAIEQSAKTKKTQLSYEQALQKEKAKGASQAAADAKLAAVAIDYRRQMNKELRQQEVLYFNVANAMGVESLEADIQLKKTLEIRGAIERLDNNLRNYQKNVGNYKSAFDGLGFSFTQVARELPSLTVSTQQFFLAISNNLPMVFDEIGKARAEIAALRAQGEAAPSLLGRVVKSIFSAQVGLAILITLITAFSSKIIDFGRWLFNIEESEKALEERTKKLKDAVKALNDEFEQSSVISRDYFEQPIEAMKKQLTIMESLKKSNADILNQREKIAQAQLKASPVSNPFMGDANSLKEYNREIEETKTKIHELEKQFSSFVIAGPRAGDKGEYEKGVKYFQDQLSVQQTLYNRLTSDVKKFNDYENELARVRAERQQYQAEQRLSIEVESAKIKAQTVIDNNERILSDERNFENERVQALRSSAKKRKDIIDAELRKVTENPSNRNADGSYTAEAINAKKQAAADIEKIDKDLAVSIFNTQEEFRKRRLAAEKEIAQAEISFSSAKNYAISQSEAAGFADRMEAYGNFYRDEQKLIEEDYYFQKATKIMTNEELLALEAEFQNKMKSLQVKAKKEVSDIFISTENSILSLSESRDKLKLSQDELILYRSLKKKTEFNKRAQQLEIEQQRATIENDNYVQREIIASALTTEDAKKKAQQRLLDNQTRLNQLELTEEQKKEAAKASMKDIFYNLELKAVETFFSLYQKLADAKHEKVMEQLREEARVEDANHAKSINNIRNSTISEQQKAAEITLLEAEHAAKKDEIARKEKDEKIKQAKTDKAIGIAKIIVETALAVVHALTTGEPYTAYARAALTAATGAAELAAAIAAPIPSYADGTEGHPGGPARYGEAGPEAVKEPGKPWKVVSKETIGFLARGTKIKPLTAQAVNDAAHGSMVHGMQERLAISEFAESIRGNEKLLKEVRDAVIETGRMTAGAIRKQKAPIVNFNVHGNFQAHIEKSVRT